MHMLLSPRNHPLLRNSELQFNQVLQIERRSKRLLPVLFHSEQVLALILLLMRFFMQLELLTKQLKNIENQAFALNNRGFNQTSKILTNLYININEAKKAYDLKTRNKKQFEEFYTKAITDAHLVLDQHRGWKQFLYNLASILVSAPTVFIINLLTGRLWLFSAETESSQLLSSLKLSLDELLQDDVGLKPKKLLDVVPEDNPAVHQVPVAAPVPIPEVVVENPLVLILAAQEPAVMNPMPNPVQAPAANSIASLPNPPHAIIAPKITFSSQQLLVTSLIPSKAGSEVITTPVALVDVIPPAQKTTAMPGEPVAIATSASVQVEVPQSLVPPFNNKTTHLLHVLKEYAQRAYCPL